MNRMSPLLAAIATIPAGRWAIGVSGGADSVALLSLARQRADLQLHVIHLNHQLRGADSEDDAQFVRDLAHRWQLSATIARLDDLRLDAGRAHSSAHYRRARLWLFRQQIAEHRLLGVLMAHHLDDQIETVVARLLRGSGYRGLCGMQTFESVSGVEVCRPLLTTRRAELHEHCSQMHQPWRQDASNATDRYQRNRLRHLLERHSELEDPILKLMAAARTLRARVDGEALIWPGPIALSALPPQPPILQEQSARVWLAGVGVPIDRIEPKVIQRLLEMMRDSASPSRLNLPGKLTVARRRGVIELD